MKTNEVRDNATQIWHFIAGKRVVPVIEVCKKLGKPNEVVMLALGWLMQENKIRLNEADNVIEVNISIAEIYY